MFFLLFLIPDLYPSQLSSMSHQLSEPVRVPVSLMSSAASYSLPSPMSYPSPLLPIPTSSTSPVTPVSSSYQHHHQQHLAAAAAAAAAAAQVSSPGSSMVNMISSQNNPNSPSEQMSGTTELGNTGSPSHQQQQQQQQQQANSHNPGHSSPTWMNLNISDHTSKLDLQTGSTPVTGASNGLPGPYSHAASQHQAFANHYPSQPQFQQPRPGHHQPFYGYYHGYP